MGRIVAAGWNLRQIRMIERVGSRIRDARGDIPHGKAQHRYQQRSTECRKAHFGSRPDKEMSWLGRSDLFWLMQGITPQ